MAWEHKGFGASTLTSMFANKRRHRDRTVPVRGVPVAALWQAVDAVPFVVLACVYAASSA